MNNLVFIKVESSDLIDWGNPSEGENQPHIVQIGAVKCDYGGNVAEAFEMIVKPEGWVISEGSIVAHGILQSVAEQVGSPERQVVQDFLDFCGDADRASFNRNFDQRLIRIALKRYFGEAEQDKWACKDNYINVAATAKSIVNAKSAKTGKTVNPTLDQAYRYFMRKDIEIVHSALAAASCCMDVYFPVKASA